MEFWPHQCIITPYTRYEQKSVLRVRECRQTVVIHPIEGVFDIDTCKWRADTIPSLNRSVSWDEIIPNDAYCDCTRFHYNSPEIKPDKRPIVKRVDTLAEQEAEELKAKEKQHQEYLKRYYDEQKLKSSQRYKSWIKDDPITIQRRLEAAAKKRQRQNW